MLQVLFVHFFFNSIRSPQTLLEQKFVFADQTAGKSRKRDIVGRVKLWPMCS